MGTGGKLKAGQSNHLDSRSTTVPSIWYLNWSNPQGGPRLPLGAVWYVDIKGWWLKHKMKHKAISVSIHWTEFFTSRLMIIGLMYI